MAFCLHIYKLIVDGGYRGFIDSYKSKSVAKNPDSNVMPQKWPFSLRLALGYRSRVGKDTAAEVIADDHGAHIIRFAEPVYDAATRYILWLKGGYYKDPELLQLTGGMMRASRNRPVDVAERKIREIELYGVFMRHNWCYYTPIAAMLKLTYNKLTSKYIGPNIVIVDMRYSDEMEMLKKHDFETVKITRRDYNQVIDRNTKHISEWGLDSKQFDHYWENLGTIDDWKHYTRQRVGKIVASKNVKITAFESSDD